MSKYRRLACIYGVYYCIMIQNTGVLKKQGTLLGALFLSLILNIPKNNSGFYGSNHLQIFAVALFVFFTASAWTGIVSADFLFYPDWF